MVAKVIDGRAIAAQVRQDITKKIADYKHTRGKAPGLAVLLIGDNPASHVYVKNKKKACEQVGIKSEVIIMPATASQDEVIAQIHSLNANPQIHGILLQLPLPKSMDSAEIISHIVPHKDVDGLSPNNLGHLFAGRPHLVPCTPLACLHLIESVVPSLDGKHVVVVGRSLLVGRTTALLMTFKNTTVVQAHSHTHNLAEECRRADILITAVGNPGLITTDFVKPGAVVIDVGITNVNHPNGSSFIRGDVDFDEVSKVAGHITPVPGGVGPMTVAYLLKNTLKAAELG
jgi:methylenetetrahydrofolate dehydrogenase (NADP+) / methenyltetrahydrofolate cyclohydrolase